MHDGQARRTYTDTAILWTSQPGGDEATPSHGMESRAKLGKFEALNGQDDADDEGAPDEDGKAAAVDADDEALCSECPDTEQLVSTFPFENRSWSRSGFEGNGGSGTYLGRRMAKIPRVHALNFLRTTGTGPLGMSTDGGVEVC